MTFMLVPWSSVMAVACGCRALNALEAPVPHLCTCSHLLLIRNLRQQAQSATQMERNLVFWAKHRPGLRLSSYALACWCLTGDVYTSQDPSSLRACRRL